VQERAEVMSNPAPVNSLFKQNTTRKDSLWRNCKIAALDDQLCTGLIDGI